MKYVILAIVVIFLLYTFIYHKALILAYKKRGFAGLMRMYVAMFVHTFAKLIVPEG